MQHHDEVAAPRDFSQFLVFLAILIALGLCILGVILLGLAIFDPEELDWLTTLV